MSTWLERPFDKEEIRKAVFHMERDEASSPNGFTMAFFQVCWDAVKDDLMGVFVDFHHNGVIGMSMDSHFITLVPRRTKKSRCKTTVLSLSAKLSPR